MPFIGGVGSAPGPSTGGGGLSESDVAGLVTDTDSSVRQAILEAVTAVIAATPLEGLANVADNVTPQDQNALAFSLDTQKWEPIDGTQIGEIPVGAWENDKTVTITERKIEHDVRASALPVPTSRPVVAQISITLTEADLCTTDDPTIGFVNDLYVFTQGYNAGFPANTTNATVNVEAALNGTVLASANDSSHTNTRRSCTTSIFKDVKVGDVVEVRVWGNTAGGVIDWWGTRALPSRIGKTQPAGGRYLYRDINHLAVAAAWVPSTVLQDGLAWASTQLSGYYYWENGVSTATGTPPGSVLSHPTTGFLRQRESEGDSAVQGRVYVGDFTTATIYWEAIPTKIRYDRIALPLPPS